MVKDRATGIIEIFGMLRLPIWRNCRSKSTSKRQHQLTLYDAAYLELALRRNLPLATLDQDLRRAAGKEKVQVLG